MQPSVGISTCAKGQSETGKRQRLVLCLDGTWNNRDDNTNVLHHFGLIREGEVPDKDGGTIFQCSEYHRGVGTGVLDRVSGGAFGIGLEQNVRNAYNWLVQNFEERDDAGRANEIYIFGFSRGAYTARSLVNFIACCGLLRRGAPLTVNQIWEEYCILGREHEERRTRMEDIFGAPSATIRRISNLICDPWQIENFEKARKSDPQVPDAEDRVPGQRVPELNETEKLLVRWSRRVRITYLGVYDTVGAMGLDALAIPALKSKLALHHNMRPTTLIQHCRHALALDEHRSSFRHTPFVAYLGREGVTEILESKQLVQDLAQPEPQTDFVQRQDWRRTRAMWNRKIEQCWFVGAHSNVGGGYADNRLAQRPFQWMLEGAMKAGLVCEEINQPLRLSDALPRPRDSFAEFVKPFFTMLFRAKRCYRPIDPPPERRATPKKAKDDKPESGFILQSINEQVDPSVFDYWAQQTRPPNLADYAKRKGLGDAHATINNPAHSWLGNSIGAYVALASWATLAAVGIAATREFVAGEHGIPDLVIWGLALVAFAFAVVDWGESRVNFSFAAGATTACKRAFLDSIYWMRAVGVVLCIVGALAAFNHLLMLGWNEEDFDGAWTAASGVIARWWLVPVAAGFGVFLSNLFEKKVPSFRLKAAAGAMVAGPALALALVFLVVLVTGFLGEVIAPVLGLGAIKPESAAQNAKFAGLLLLLQVGALCFKKALSWCGEPMVKANLGSIVPLQFCARPESVDKCLDTWCHRLTGRQHGTSGEPPSPECSMCRIVSEALWRDIIGFVPVYALVLGFGWWFAIRALEWEWLKTELSVGSFRIPLWFLVPFLTAAADWIEDFSHLHYLKLHAHGRLPGLALSRFTFAMSLVKMVGFIFTVVLALLAIFAGSWACATASYEAGWRGLLAFSITIIVTAVVALVLGTYISGWFKERRMRKLR